MKRTAAISLLVLLVGAMVAIAPAAAKSPLPTGYDVCDMYAFRQLVDPALVRKYVPERYKFQPAQGFAQVQVVAARCDPLTIGGRTEAMDYALFCVQLSDPAGCYDFWEFSDSALAQSTAARLGRHEPPLPGLVVEYERDPVTGEPMSAHQEVPWPESPWTMDARILAEPLTTPDQVVFPSVHWFEGCKGTIKRTDDNYALSAGAAVITFETEPGSKAAELLGAHRLTTAGAFLHFEADFRWELIGDGESKNCETS